MKKSFIAMISLFIFPSSAQSAILLDNFPTGDLFTETYLNNSDNQNFLVPFYVSENISITGIEILGGKTSFPWSLGDPGRIKIRKDDGGKPDDENIYSFVDQVETLESYDSATNKIGINFDPIALEGGLYWIGLSGDGQSRNLAVYDSVYNTYVTNLQGDMLGPTYSIFGRRTIAVRVYDDRPAGSVPIPVPTAPFASIPVVPEPSVWMMMLVGIGVIGAGMRRRLTRLSPPVKQGAAAY